MIIISPSLVLSYSALPNENVPIICAGNLVTISNVAADREDADYPATNLANPQTSSLWKSGSTADQYVTITLDGTIETDYLAIARHNLGSGLVVASVEAMTASVSWAEVAGETLLGTNEPAIFLFDADFYTGIRLKLQPGSVEPQAAVVYVGASIQMPKGLQPGHVPLTYARNRTYLNGMAMNGDYLGDVVMTQKRSSAVSFKALDGGWYRDTFDDFVQDSDTPFFFAWRPVAYPREVGFAWATSVPQPVQNYLRPDLIDISIQMDGLAL